jgi:serine/threonine protein kinase
MNIAPESDAPTPGLPIGARLGDFEIKGFLGKGGFSVVYTAWDHSLARAVAIKEYMPNAIAICTPMGDVAPRTPRDEEPFKAGRTSFLEEARLLAKFTHPALVHVYRVWEQNGTAYMAMQLCTGKTLSQISQAEPALVKDEGWLKTTFTPVLDALELLHAQHCFHRDISPDNILIQQDSQPILLDFGAARQVVGGMTQGLTVVLKPGFAPVEQYADDPSQQGPWTDVYGVGAVLYYLITGMPPVASVARLVKDPLVKLADSSKFTGTSRSFRAGIDRALAVQASARIRSIAELRQALQMPTYRPSGQTVQPATTGVPAASVELPADPEAIPVLERSGSDKVQPESPAIPDSSVAALQPLSEPHEQTGNAPDTPIEKILLGTDDPADPSLQSTHSAELGDSGDDRAVPPPASIQAPGDKALDVEQNPGAVPVGKVIRAPLRFRKPVLLMGLLVAAFAVGFSIASHKPAVNDGQHIAAAPAPEKQVVPPLPPPAMPAQLPTDNPAVSMATAPPPITGNASASQTATPEISIASAPSVVPAQAPIPKINTPPIEKKTAKAAVPDSAKITNTNKKTSHHPVTAALTPARSPAIAASSPTTSARVVRHTKIADTQKSKAAAPESAPAASNKTSIVHLSIAPWGQVSVDGQVKGTSPPLLRLPLTPGQHTITVTNGKAKPFTTQITVPEQGETSVSHQFQ